MSSGLSPPPNRNNYIRKSRSGQHVARQLSIAPLFFSIVVIKSRKIQFLSVAYITFISILRSHISERLLIIVSQNHVGPKRKTYILVNVPSKLCACARTQVVRRAQTRKQGAHKTFAQTIFAHKRRYKLRECSEC